MKYDISIIIPFFNNENFLEKAINSIISEENQSINYEIILVNDCSTDNSLEIAKKFLNYKNVTIINKEKNEGVSAARNDGIRKATGKYIMLLDGDDFLSSDAITKLFDFFEKHKDEVDLVTYPLYLKKHEKDPIINPKYDIYDKGTNVYSIEEYPYINQTTINIIFKNDKKYFFDKTLRLAEDQKFVTSIIMKKKKIGYCKEAKYIYRRYGGGVSQIYNNFYYCYDDIMRYNKWLINTYKNNNKIPQYIQGMILNTLSWRLNKDMLFPYYMESNDFEVAVKEIFSLLEYIDIDYIYNYPRMTLQNKIYFLKQKSCYLKLETRDNFVNLITNNVILDKFNKFSINVKRNKIVENKLYFRALLEDRIWDIEKPKVYLIIRRKNKIEKKELSLFESTLSKNKSRVKITNIYGFNCLIDLNDIDCFYFELCFMDKNFILECSYDKFASPKKMSKNYIINYQKSSNKYFVKKTTPKNKIKYLCTNVLKKSNKHLKLQLYKFFLTIIPSKPVWLYCDGNTLDNAYYQFIHDVTKKDGIKKYYVCDEKTKKNIDKKYYKNIIISNSKKHKWLYLKANNILTSNVSLTGYSPFKKIDRIKDILNYQLIYLPQHIIHVNSSKLYNKENNEVDKIIISSNFEEKNLIKNYGYSKEDFVISSFEKYNAKKEKIGNKILFCISSRSYLIFKNKINISFFKNSTFCKNINEFITNKKLLKFLEENNLTLDIKLDDDFIDYNNCFEIKSNKIKIINSQIDLSEYKMLITDFSPIQFEILKFVRPIIYFIPDINEFKAGLHLFREIDLSEKENFGITCLKADELIDKIENFAKNQFEVENKYKVRMRKFLLSNNDYQKVYNSINNINRK